MSFLSPEESLRLSILSKLSSAHLSSPSIYFFSSFWKFHEDLFLDSVRSSLKRRRTLDDTTIQKLSFDLYVFTDRRSPHWALKTLKSAAETLEDLANFALEKNIPDVFLTCHGNYETCRDWQDTNVTILLSSATIIHLSLVGIKVDSRVLTLTCPLIEDLFLRSRLVNEFKLPNERKRQRIEIDILAARKSLKFLKLCYEHEIIAAKWFRKNVAQFESLETLILEYCGAVKNERKNLILKDYRLIKQWIENNLSVVFISSNLEDVELCFEYLDCTKTTENLTDFLNRFAHCNTVKFKSSSNRIEEYFIYTEQVRKTLIPPLYGVKHLEIQVPTLVSKRIVELFCHGVPETSEVEEEEDCTVNSLCWPHDGEEDDHGERGDVGIGIGSSSCEKEQKQQQEQE
ncbi:hypothetical protein TIFTF001_025565 [Ficus carica]|uniref:Uncharacterized protein n=1 Tax=Ficus carica TaxID=3494 RepID=A0AA88DFM5_FICCA|nr:hypothetical protein TIFTF001_025565 [Ficus carica]